MINDENEEVTARIKCGQMRKDGRKSGQRDIFLFESIPTPFLYFSVLK
jgi:hypothetical protein